MNFCLCQMSLDQWSSGRLGWAYLPICFIYNHFYNFTQFSFVVELSCLPATFGRRLIWKVPLSTPVMYVTNTMYVMSVVHQLAVLWRVGKFRQFRYQQYLWLLLSLLIAITRISTSVNAIPIVVYKKKTYNFTWFF